MNWFKLYIGDYQRDTAHLSVTEHGAYLLMLQHYYATEKPLPTGKALHRMLRAQDRAEREAIDAVAGQFWTETPEGLVNGRADAEITKAGTQAETNRAIAQAREAKRKASRDKHDDSTNRATKLQPNQTPDTRHQTEQPSENYHHPAGGLAPGEVDVVGEARPTAAGAVCKALRRAGIADTNPGHPRLLALLNAGATEAEFAGFAPAAIAKGAGFAWVLGAVEGERTRAAATGKAVHNGPMPAAGKSQFIADREAQASRWIGTAVLPGMAGEIIDMEAASHGATPAIR